MVYTACLNDNCLLTETLTDVIINNTLHFDSKHEKITKCRYLEPVMFARSPTVFCWI